MSETAIIYCRNNSEFPDRNYAVVTIYMIMSLYA